MRLKALHTTTLILAAAALALAGCQTTARKSGGTQVAVAAKKPADPLTAMNKRFNAEYGKARAALLDKTTPVIIVAFDELILLRNGERRREKFTPAIYHHVKAVSHVSLALYVMLAPTAGQRFTPEKIADLKSYRALVADGIASLPGRGLPPGVLALHQAMGARSLAYIDEVQAAGRASPSSLQRYVDRMAPRTLQSAQVAADAQLDALHALMTRWRGEMSAAEWKALNVVVLGPKQPRPGNLQYAYFQKLMGRRAEGKRLWYAEGVFSEKGGRTLLGTILLDRGASAAFFRSPTRLERDLLADAAARWIGKNM